MQTLVEKDVGISPMTAELLKQLGDPDVSLGTMVSLIGADPKLSEKLLQAANSVAFGSGRFSNDLRTAISMLGWNQVTSLAACFSLHNESMVRRDQRGIYSRLWLHSIIQATAAGLVGTKRGPSHRAECFLAGLLAKAGELTSLRNGSSNGNGPGDLDPTDIPLINDSESIRRSTVELLERWDVPSRFVDSIRNAGMPLMGLRVLPTSDARHLVYAVAIAEAVGSYFCDEHKGYALIRVHELCCDLFSMSSSETQALLDEVQLRLRESSRLFNIDASALQSRAGMMVEAMAQIASLRQPRANETPDPGVFTVTLDENATADDLLRRTVIDPISGVFSRDYFDEQIPHLARMARERRQSLGLLLIDVDRLKAMNDECGSDAGDAVLRQVATTLVQTVRGCDFVARYRDDEFAVVVVNASLEGLQVLARRMRCAVAKIKVGAGVTSSWVTVSGGAALITPGSSDQQSTETLTAAAVRALAAAQRNGRQRIEVETTPNKFLTV